MLITGGCLWYGPAPIPYQIHSTRLLEDACGMALHLYHTRSIPGADTGFSEGGGEGQGGPLGGGGG